MKPQSSSNLEIASRLPSWPPVLIAIVVIKAVLSLAVKPGSALVSYSGVSYFLLLLLATGFAIRNGLQNTLGRRSFWVLLAIAYGFWTLDQWFFVYYELVLHVEVPANSMADPVLFLHVVPFIAALATLPHRNTDSKLYRIVLNSLLVLFFWGFLYGYYVFPYQYLSSNAPATSYALRFDILYLAENLVLVLAAALLTFRAHHPWKSIYLHLLGASTLYALSSAMANLAIDSGGYVNGKLYGLGLTGAVCWFVWIPLSARRIPRAETESTQSEIGYGSQASIWAMLVVVMISIPIVWELFTRDNTNSLRTVRLLVAIAAIVLLASAAYVREYLAKHELALRVGLANDRLRLAMESGKSVGWDWDIKSGRDAWFGDLKTMFGIPSDTYVGRVEDFHRRVHPDDRAQVSSAVNAAMQSRKPYEAEFRITQPDGSAHWVAARGTFYYSRDGTPERMLGMAVDITERKQVEEVLRLRETELTEAQRLAQVGSWHWDPATDTVTWSEELYRIAGRDSALPAVSFKEHPHLYSAESWERLREAVEEALHTGAPYELELEMVRADGTRRWIKARGEVHRDSVGRNIRLRGTAQDITESKQIEEALSNVSRRVIEAEERERYRISVDLHEGIGQRLSLVAIQIEQLLTDLADQPAGLLNRMDEVWRHIVNVLADVKASAHELHSPRLEYLDIATVIRCFCNEFGERKGVQINFRNYGQPGLVPPDVAICLFRVLQEALYNGVKHSGAQQFEVQLWETQNEVHLAVRDSGVGFDAIAARTGNGLGFVRMEQRLKLVRGTFSIESRPHGGATIHARVPLSLRSDSMRAAG